jgi:hypothetical protein
LKSTQNITAGLLLGAANKQIRERFPSSQWRVATRRRGCVHGCEIMSQVTEPSTSGDVAGGGKIGRSPTVQTILAVAFLIIITLLSFLAVIFLGTLLGSSDATYWMIELIFALLCGGAGALVGGSADVRSTLNLPGSPVQARLGGAVAMVIVGFTLAYLGKPSNSGEPTYSVQIGNVPHSANVGNVQYSVVVSSADDDMSISRKGRVITITIPSSVQMYTANLVVFTADRDNPKVFARCILTFDIQKKPEDVTKEILPDDDSHFRVSLLSNYVDKVVHKWSRVGHAVDDEPCVEGRTATANGDSLPLSGYFILVPAGAGSRFANMAHLAAAPTFAIMASAPARDVPPTKDLPGGGVTSQQPTATTAQAPSSLNPPITPNMSAGQGANERPTGPVAAVSDLSAQVDAYIHGQNLDRTQLYESWGQVDKYVVEGFRTEASKSSPLAARYVNLIANALNVIEGGKYLPPTLRPNWDQSIKPDRLANNIPAFEPADYGRVVDLLCSADEDNKAAAQRLLRLFPSDNFSQSIENLGKRADCDLIYVPETAIYYYYNRIVEYDGTFAVDKESRDWLENNYSRGRIWLKLLSDRMPTDDVFGAVLDYAYGITLWDRGDVVNQKNALSYFTSMLNTVHSSNGSYPLNKAHIAIALAILNDPKTKLKTLESAVPYKSGGLFSVSGNYIASGTDIVLFALPEPGSKEVGKMAADARVRIYMRTDEWDLVQAAAQIGWAQRVPTSVGKSMPRS